MWRGSTYERPRLYQGRAIPLCHRGADTLGLGSFGTILTKDARGATGRGSRATDARTPICIIFTTLPNPPCCAGGWVRTGPCSLNYNHQILLLAVEKPLPFSIAGGPPGNFAGMMDCPPPLSPRTRATSTSLAWQTTFMPRGSLVSEILRGAAIPEDREQIGALFLRAKPRRTASWDHAALLASARRTVRVSSTFSKTLFWGRREFIMNNQNLIGGSGMAVALGVGCVIVPWFCGSAIDLLGKFIIVLFGIVLIAAGLFFSRGKSLNGRCSSRLAGLTHSNLELMSCNIIIQN